MLVYNDPKEYLRYFNTLKTKAIIHIELPQETMFYIMKCDDLVKKHEVVFVDMPTYVPNMHFMKFVWICTSYNLPGQSKLAI